MMNDRICEKIIESYSGYYDIDRNEAFGSTGSASENPAPDALVARMDLHIKESSYVLLKRNVLWEAGSHEYAYLFRVKTLTSDDYQKLETYVLSNGMKRINPGPGHKCSILSMIIIADHADSGAISRIRRCRIHKSFRFALDGWMDFRTGLAVLSTGKAYSNMSGHENRGFLKKILKNAV